jgi:transcriptional regulator with XRE-family HTH domain
MDKPKTKKEIAHEMGISPRTLSRWLKAKNIQLPRGLINEADQQLIKQVLAHSKLS